MGKRQAWIGLMALALGGIILLGINTAGAAGPARPAIVEVPSDVVTNGLTVDDQLLQQMELTNRLVRDLPAISQRERISITFAQDDLDAIDRGDRAVSPLPIGLVRTISPAIILNGLAVSAGRTQLGKTYTGKALRASDGGFVWSLEVTAEQAGAIRLHLENVNLPDGVELYIYSMTGESYGPFTGQGPDGTGEFWAPTVFGTETLVQVHAPANAPLRGVTLRVSEVGLLTPQAVGRLTGTPMAANFCGNPSCIVDASCQNGANSIRDAYAKMEWVAGAFIYTCTGGLLNDTNPSSTNYFLTANHCLSKSNTAKNVNFYWRFRTSTCNGTCPSNSGWPFKTIGSTVAATGRRGDFTLLALNTAPPSGSVRLGFTNAPVANTNGVALHRVSNPNFGPQVYNEQNVDTSAGTCSGWPRGERIYSRDTLGGTDGGSSGSPVVNGSDLVVGQLSGACGTNVNDPCDSAHNATVDGALAFYWLTVKPFINP